MGLINWIFDIYQHTQIDKARTEVAVIAQPQLAANTEHVASSNAKLKRTES